jgi:hypothetical protein
MSDRMTTLPDEQRGIYGKYRVERVGGTPGKHDECFYYVLDLDHDPFALPALRAYADSCRERYPELAADLDRLTGEHLLEGLDGPSR